MSTNSHSRLSTFEDCPLKYKYTYVDRLDRERRDSIEAFMGGLVHETSHKPSAIRNWSRFTASVLLSGKRRRRMLYDKRTVSLSRAGTVSASSGRQSPCGPISPCYPMCHQGYGVLDEALDY